ncbi:GumC family protein [Mesorhizobium caraganae]|uniref:GumC family protein n=1 Tax=Mesorhizobium caraganae TaxID=483206 RepID=UPI003ECE3A03
MEGSIVSRIHLPRTTEMRVAVHETNPRMRRRLREPMDTQTPFGQLIITIARRKWFLLAMVVFGGAFAGLVGFSRPAVFEATTQVIVDSSMRTAPDGTGGQDMLDTSIDNHLTMLLSQGHLRRVVAALRKTEADQQADVGGSVAQGSAPEAPTEKRSFAANLLDRILPHGSDDAAELKTLRRGLRVGQELRSRVITVGFSDKDPVRAALVANTFARVYVDDLARNSQTADRAELASIVAALPTVQSDLAEATDRLEEYRLSHGTVDQGAADNAARETADLNQQLALSKADLTTTESRLQKIQDLQKSGASPAALADVIGSPALADLLAHPADNTAGNDPAGAINREIEQGIARIAAEASTYRAQIAALETRKNVLEAVVTDTAGRLSGMRALEPKVTILTQRYNELLTRQQDLSRRIASPSSGVSIISTAWPPRNPKSLSPVYLIPPGMVVFGLIGGILVLLGNRLDQTLRGEAETETALGFPCLGLLPKVSRPSARRLQQLVLGQQQSIYSRAAMSLLVNATPLQARGRPSQVVLVTSSDQSDGKTELAWSLALAATRLGGRVLFIDFDRHDARLTSDFVSEFSILKPHRSFGDYAKGRCDLEGVISSMPEIGVDFMAAPALSDDLLKLLFTMDAPRQFMDRLGSVYSLVVLNGPPGLGGPESRLLAGWADSVLFAVRWAKTPRNVARGVLELLQPEEPGSVPVGTVLTQVNLKQHAAYHFGDGGDLLLVGA